MDFSTAMGYDSIKKHDYELKNKLTRSVKMFK